MVGKVKRGQLALQNEHLVLTPKEESKVPMAVSFHIRTLTGPPPLEAPTKRATMHWKVSMGKVPRPLFTLPLFEVPTTLKHSIESSSSIGTTHGSTTPWFLMPQEMIPGDWHGRSQVEGGGEMICHLPASHPSQRTGQVYGSEGSGRCSTACGEPACHVTLYLISLQNQSLKQQLPYLLWVDD